MLKKVRAKYTKEFRAMALERMKACSNICALAEELGIPRERLYQWSRQKEPGELPQSWREEWKGKKRDEEKLRLTEHLQQVKQLLAEKTMEVDFLKGALRRVEARRRKGNSGGETSMSKSSK